MARTGRLHHNPRLLDQLAGYWHVSENVGVSEPGVRSDQVRVVRLHDAFLASPDHLASVHGPFTSVGVSVVRADRRLWVTVVFAAGPVVVHPVVDVACGATVPAPRLAP